ncbi:MAG: MFS transporter, partial [Chlamydiia bacterium]|nr:MFS transporter [Chlamydiia bacterium]
SYQTWSWPRRCALFLGIPLMMYMTTMHTMVMAALIAPIVDTFGHLSDYSCTTSAFLLASMGTMPLYGRLCDQWGPKRVALLGCTVFSVASLGCALAPSFWTLVATRALQGTGSSSMLTAGYVMYGKIFSIERRAIVLGVLGAACALAMFTGPSIGAAIEASFGWRWVFIQCIPATLFSGLLVWMVPLEPDNKAGKSIDWFGGLLFLSAAIAITHSIAEIVEPNSTPRVLGFGLTGMTLLLILYRHCRKTPGAYLALHLLSEPALIVSLLIGFLTGAVMFSFPYLTNILGQGVLGIDARMASSLAIPVSLAWIAASLLSGLALTRFGLRAVLQIGTVFFLLAFLGLVWKGTVEHRSLLLTLSTLTGTGLGLCLNATVYAAQSRAPAAELGAATSFMNLIRVLGGAWGGASVITVQLLLYKRNLLSVAGADVFVKEPERILRKTDLAGQSPEVVEAVRGVFYDAIVSVSAFGGIACVLGLVLIYFWAPRRVT